MRDFAKCHDERVIDSLTKAADHSRKTKGVFRLLRYSVVRGTAVNAIRRHFDAECLFLYGGIGDSLLLSTLAHELKKRGTKNIYILSEYAELFNNNPDVSRVARPGSRHALWLARLARAGQIRQQSYSINYNPVEDIRDPPPSHVLHYLCEQIGIKGRIELKPYFVATAAELEWGANYAGCIAVQSGSMNARWAILNKQWDPQRFARIAGSMMRSHKVVQVGHANDQAIPCHVDLRGRTTLRQLAAVLAHSRLFVGLIGMPMHLARAVECPSIIVYGGRERPEQSGYSCNFNIFSDIECAPCWRDNRCEFDRRCMSIITEQSVLAAIGTMLDRQRNPLTIDISKI